MTPYENLSFFALLMIPVLPAIVMGFIGVSRRLRLLWLMAATIFMLWIIYMPLSALLQAGAFFLWSFLIVRGFLYRRTKSVSAKTKQQADPSLRSAYWLCLFLALLPLVLVKLSPYAKSLGMWQSPLGFLGISYLTFRTVGTLIEIRDGLIKEVHLGDFFLFVLFFPTLASGPIDRYRRFLGDLNKTWTRSEQIELLTSGIDHIFRGLLYKFILAYLINAHWLSPLSKIATPGATLQYMYAYSFYLFFDFAGYSAFAVGVSHLLGIRTPENFNRPFVAKNIKDFWNRWHMSLSFWFRDYIFMRFVLMAAKKKWFQNRYTSAYLGYLLLFGIMGLWHGLEARYLVYGLYHAGLMSGYDWLERKNKTHPFWKEAWANSRLGQGISMVVTAHFVFFGFLIFSGRLF